MLVKLLKVIYDEGGFSYEAIERELNLKKEDVDFFKEQLIRKDLIIKEELCNKEMCKKCSCGCSTGDLNKLSYFKISDKAINILKKHYKEEIK